MYKVKRQCALCISFNYDNITVDIILYEHLKQFLHDNRFIALCRCVSVLKVALNKD